MDPWHSDNLPKATNDEALMRRQLDEFGYCIIQNALNENTIGKLQSRLIEQAECERKLHNHKNPANMDSVNQWVGMLLNKGEVFMELVEHELCMGLMEYLLGEDYLVSCVDAQIQHPGAGDMPLHTDQWWMPTPISAEDIRVAPSSFKRGENGSVEWRKPSGKITNLAEANVMWFVTDFKEENGATRIVPGSHISGNQPDPSIPHKVPSIPATGPAGTAIAFDGRIWHSGAANHTQESRYGITTACCGPQFRTIENYTRGMRPEVFDRCRAETLARLGFKPRSGYGHTGNPDEAIASEGKDSMGSLHYDQ